MRILWAVCKDLWQFATYTLLPQQRASVAESIRYLPARASYTPLGAPAPHLTISNHEPTSAASQSDTAAHAVMCATASATVPLYTNPVQGFDSVRVRVPYATTLRVLKSTGRWYAVEYRGQQLWALQETLAPLADVLPRFRTGKVYTDPADPEVVRLRACIEDAFHAGTVSLPLLDVEYVTYELWLHGAAIPWPESYGRVAGTWQRKLRGVPGVHIDVRPRTGAVMEYIVGEMGYVAYVDEVLPDDTIVVRAVGLTHEAQFTEERVPPSVWREIHPVFITIL